jgi:biotin carboxylase
MPAKSALILGTLAGQVDAIELLKSKGWRVYACGHRRDGPGVDAADDFFLVDILDVEAVTALADRLQVDIVYSVGSDIAMPTIARVNERLGLPSFHNVGITDTLQRKDLLRQALDSAGLSPVQHRKLTSVRDLEGFTAYPAIVKPSDSQGQRGITIVETPEEAIEVVETALGFSNSGTAIIEEWLDGPEISVHVFAVDGRVRFFLPSDRHVWSGDMIGVASGHTIPAYALDSSARAAVRTLVQDFVTSLNVETGPLYFQMIVTEHGPRIIEVASRLDGCHLWRLIEQNTGFNLMSACFDVLAGEPWVDPEMHDAGTTDVLGFHLGPPGQPFHLSDYLLPDEPAMTFQEIQVADGELPRDVNGVISRLGYYMTTEPS